MLRVFVSVAATPQAEALKQRISHYDNDVAGPEYTYDATAGKITTISYALFDTTMTPDMRGTLLPDGAKARSRRFPTATPRRRAW